MPGAVRVLAASPDSQIITRLEALRLALPLRRRIVADHPPVSKSPSRAHGRRCGASPRCRDMRGLRDREERAQLSGTGRRAAL